ncbi:MAG: benzoate transporter [Actinobacteria bacterium]|nr:MAG: benzoate transporter [Actinomycetota bacterium]
MMRFARCAALLAALAMLLAGATAEGATAKQGRLVAFRSCGELLAYAKSQATRFVGPWGLGNGLAVGMTPPVAGAPTRDASPQQGVDYSGTNVQEQGVDEPDTAKTNGTTLFAVANGTLNAVDVGERRPRLLDSLKLDPRWSHELLLDGNRLLVLSRAGFWVQPLPALAARILPPAPSQSVLEEIDVSNPKALRVVRTLTLDGAYVAARLVGHSARIVTASQVPGELPFVAPAGTTDDALAAARDRNRAVVAASGVASWLPSYRIGKTSRPLVQCRHVQRPPAFSGLGMLTVLTLDLAKGIEPVDSVAVMTDGRIVYASPQSLYVATEQWAVRPEPGRPTLQKSGAATAIHKFDISSPVRTVYRGSGSVPGYLLSQWSLSEYRGVLRVVSTETPAWWGPGDESESFLTTLRERNGTLVQAGRVGDLGKGERVYAVRFVGDVGYVVTFRQIDPLYTVDLAQPERPHVFGALKIPGYSAYLHPIGDGLLLGVGQDANEQGRPVGTQLSLFDVSDLRQPVRLQHASLGLGWSEAESDHHAFLYWPRTGLVVVPFQERAVGFRVSRANGIREVGRVAQSGSIRRSFVVRDAVVTISDAGVESSSLATLSPLGWAAFPSAEPPIKGAPNVVP